MVWRSFVQAGGSGFQSFSSSFWFFLPSVAPVGKYSVWSAQDLPSTFGGRDQWAARGSGCQIFTILDSSQFCCLFSFFFWPGEDQSVQWVVLVYSRGSWWIPRDTWGSPVWSDECLPNTFGADEWWVDLWVGQRVGGSSMGVATHWFFQCIVVWRSLPWVRGSECQSFSSPCCSSSAKCVSRISARSLIHRAHTVFICVTIAILDLPWSLLFIEENTNKSKHKKFHQTISKSYRYCVEL
jgi:hypothetical protein